MGEICDLKGRTVLVTGAAGFLGRAVRTALVGAGARVIGIDRNPAPDDCCHGWLQQSCGEGRLALQRDEADTLIHLAWDNLPSRGDRDLAGDIDRNVRASVQVFEQAVQAGVGRIVYPSSGGTIYGAAAIPTPEEAPIQPLGGYAAGKASIELFLRALHHASGVDACVLRLANPYGPGQKPDRGQGFIATAAKRSLKREPVEIFGDGGAVRDFVYVEDVARAFVLATARSSGFSIYNIGGGRPVTIAEAVERVFDAARRRSGLNFLPARLTDLPQSCLDISRAARELGWVPTTPFDTGVRATVAWQRRLLAAAATRRRSAPWTARRLAGFQQRPLVAS